jgi:hypothetical protein
VGPIYQHKIGGCLQQEEGSSTHSLNHPPISYSLSLSLESKNKDELEREDDGGKEEKEKREKWKKQARSALHFLDPWLAQELSHSIFMTISISLNPWLYSSRALSLIFLKSIPKP